MGLRVTRWQAWALLGCSLAAAAEPDALQQLARQQRCPDCDLRDADLRGWALLGADLSRADLRDARLDGSNLRGAILRGADLRGVDLSQMRLAGADLRGADLRHLHLDRDLEFIDLRGVQWEGARFAQGQRCGPLPAKGGFGCSAVQQQGLESEPHTPQ